MARPSESRRLATDQLHSLRELSVLARGDILKMTKLANSGHPGGSMSSIDFYLVTYAFAALTPDTHKDPARDRVIVSHGHTSPGVYATLGRLGFFDIDDCISTFRLCGSPYEGHVERHLPGVEWSTGNLGQGLSAACGHALAARLLEHEFEVFCCMSDAEQAKGQVAEARRFAAKFGLSNLTVIVDYNQRQISGKTGDIMPVNIAGGFLADDWAVIEVDGHSHEEIHDALVEAVDDGVPTCIIAHTIMGKGVRFMEGDHVYHGRALTDDEYGRAMAELGIDASLEEFEDRRKRFTPSGNDIEIHPPAIRVNTGAPRTYESEVKTDNRSAFGAALADLGRENLLEGTDGVAMAVFDCDLAESVKTDAFAKAFPRNFFEAGVSEHNTATVAGALSTQGVLTFFADFGVFGIDEVYNQQRLNAINGSSLKLVTTHCGIDVGEDGKTHHCLDYVGALRNVYGWRVIVPADPNQTDRAVRWAAANAGNYLIATGRSKLHVITDEDGRPCFGRDYKFVYGKADLIRSGESATIVAMGSTVHRAIRVRDILDEQGIDIAVINISSPLDIDEGALVRAASTGLIVTYEDHNVQSGLGAEIARNMMRIGMSARLMNFGVDRFAPSGSADDVFAYLGLDPATIGRTLMAEIAVE